LDQIRQQILQRIASRADRHADEAVPSGTGGGYIATLLFRLKALVTRYAASNTDLTRIYLRLFARPILPTAQLSTFAIFKIREYLLQDIEDAQKEVFRTSTDMNNAKTELDRATANYNSLTNKKRADAKDKQYNVPLFRGNPLNPTRGGSNENKLMEQLKNMFFDKWKYARDFNPDLTAGLSNDKINACIQAIFKSLQDPTASIQNLEGIQFQLSQDLAKIFPRTGGATGATAGTAGGPVRAIDVFTKEDVEESRKVVSESASADTKSYIQILQGKIIAAASEFLDSYHLSSLANALRSDKKLTVAKIDSAMEEAISTLKAGKSSADYTIAERKYAMIKDLINQYQRLLGKVHDT
jgi:hypothetical protein